MQTLKRLAVLIVVLGGASPASAGDKIWNVPGVVNNGVATAFSCTNRGTAAATVMVQAFNKDGTAAGSASVNTPAGATANVVTKAVAMLGGGTFDSLYVSMGAAEIRGGSAQITAPSGVFCSAYIIDHLTDPPTIISPLKVIKKTTQKGD
jgi:hypothetical protein